MLRPDCYTNDSDLKKGISYLVVKFHVDSNDMFYFFNNGNIQWDLLNFIIIKKINKYTL